jgi:hypothetical protein
MYLVGHVARIQTKNLSSGGFGYLKERDQLRDKAVNGMIILRWNLHCVRMTKINVLSTRSAWEHF